MKLTEAIDRVNAELSGLKLRDKDGDLLDGQMAVGVIYKELKAMSRSHEWDAIELELERTQDAAKYASDLCDLIRFVGQQILTRRAVRAINNAEADRRELS